MATTAQPTSFLATRQGKLVLVLLCAVAFLDFLDASIVNVALPTIRRDLHFTVQNLQWVLSGYLLTYGGFLLLGGRMADLLGRRRILLAGTSVFALSSLTAGLASSAGLLVGARLAQGVGAAMMSPAALSILTTSFNRGTDRLKALGAWGAMAGISSAAGVFLGGLLSAGPGWRWVFFVNLPVCAIIIPATFRLIGGERHRAPLANFDTPGAIFVTAGMLLLVYTLIRVPDVGWSAGLTIAGLSGALVLFVVFAFNELRHRNPLVPLSIFRIQGLAAADVTQVIAMAGFYSTFFFITLYMQTVLHFSPLRAGSAYLPVTFGVAVSAGICSKLFEKTGTRPLIVGGALVAGGAVYWLSRIPVNGSYLTDLLVPLVIMSLGLGAVFVGVQTAAQADVPAEKAGLAAAMINSSLQVGAALGLAIFSVIATTRTQNLLAHHVSGATAYTAGFQRALLVCGIFLVGAALIATRATNTRGEPIAHDEALAASHSSGRQPAASEKSYEETH
jgi:EmrB/QacA subfamily drug resistance transporter